MNKRNFKAFLAMLLTVVMVFSIVPMSVAAEETTVTFDFSSLTGKGTEITSSNALSTFKGCASDDSYLTAVTTSKIYNGNGSGGLKPNASGFIKTGTGSANGELTMTFTEKVNKVELVCHAWTINSTDNVSVNGSATQKAPTNGDITEKLTFEIDASETVSIVTAKRTFIKSITVYLVASTGNEGGSDGGETTVPSEATISFADTANRTTINNDQQVWEQNGITVTNDKAASTSNVASYFNPVRFYKSSNVTIEYPGMTKIVVNAASSSYATVWSETSNDSNATVTLDGSTATVTFATAVDSVVFEKLSAQTQVNSITVYTGNTEGGETPEVPETTPEVPETTLVTAPETGVAYKFGMVQGNVDNKLFYLAGGMSGYYMATTEDSTAAIDVYLEETEGGYYLYTMVDNAKTYINMVVSGTYVNGAYEATASTVYTWNAEKNTIVAVVNDADYWFGTRNDKTYTTVGPCAVSYNGFYCQFYTVASEEGGTTPEVPETTPETPTVTLPFEDGDSFAIYYPAGGTVIGTLPSDAKLSAVEATLADGKITRESGMAEFTVDIIEGNVFCLIADGKYLTSGETGSSLSLEDELTDYAGWTLEEAEGGWYIKNVNAAYNGKAQYIEYFSGFTTYGMNASNADIYTFNFYALEGTVEEEEVVIYETSKEIVDAAYELEVGATLSGGHKYTLTGVITSVDDPYSEQYKNVTVTIVVDGMTDKPIVAFRLKGDGADVIKVGDTITVTGSIVNWDNKDGTSTVEFNSGCTLDSYTAAPEEPETNVPKTGDMIVVLVGAVLVAGAALVIVSRKRRFN